MTYYNTMIYVHLDTTYYACCTICLQVMPVGPHGCLEHVVLRVDRMGLPWLPESAGVHQSAVLGRENALKCALARLAKAVDDETED